MLSNLLLIESTAARKYMSLVINGLKIVNLFFRTLCIIIVMP